MKKSIYILLFCISILNIYSQEYFPNNESVQNKNNNLAAFINAKIIVSPTQTIEKGTLLVQNGRVISVGSTVQIPKNSLVVDLAGKWIYPSFIDIYTNFGVEKPKRSSSSDRSPMYDTKRTGYYWSEHIKSEINGFDNFKYDATKAEAMLKAGFGVVGTHHQDGVARGTGAIIALNNFDPKTRIITNIATNHYGFTRSATTNQAYPSSLMGMIALVRQFNHDFNWYKNGNSKTKDLSLEAQVANQNLPQIFDAGDKLNSLRAAKLGKEFGINYILKGQGNEFERIAELKQTGASMIIPINFPEPYDVSDPFQANQMELADLRFWNQAPTNLKALADNGINFALTTDLLKKTEDFRTNLLKAISYGFDANKALAALTTVPAKLLGKSSEIGTLNAGSYANFIVTSGEIFDRKTIFFENHVQGNKYVINDLNQKDIRGNYDLSIENQTYQLKIDGDATTPKFDIQSADKKKVYSKLTFKNNTLAGILKSNDTIKNNFTRINGLVENLENFSGKAFLADGTESFWKATKTDPFKIVKDSTKVEKLPKLVSVTLPNLPFGNAQKPAQETLLFKNATVWTNEKEGILKETDVLVKNGKVVSIGKNINDATAKIIDAKGKHLTAGIIDEHSHIAISRGVNEGGHNSSAEVTIEDVVNSEDVNIYRQVAGGVTTSQLLHGSANPIGGRSAIVKWKWGLSPDEMLYQNQPKFIKFALGENVKQSNWGIDNPTRFPQTRMGVEQVFTDYFQRAKEYDLAWKTFNSSAKKDTKKAPRVDIEMQTLSEILNNKRFITCHSYVQSEILMLMNVADKMGFKVNTYTHILEGYKVANEMKAHGVGASTFSDWWAYKFEVNDAIPYNGAIMHRAGVLVAYNSDDAEMSRRLNQEAAKAVKYGGITEEDAWKFVTLNPAKMLHIDDKVGSVKVGKDADLVLWNDNPLSIYAKAEKTLIEGVVYFDLDRETQKQKDIVAERAMLIGQMLSEKNVGASTQAPKKKEKVHYECDTEEEF